MSRIPGMSDQILMGLLVLQTAILVAGIPWAFKIHAAVSSIEATMKHLPNQGDYTKLIQRVTVLETKVAG